MANDATASLSLTEQAEQQREISTHKLPGFKGVITGWVNAVVRARERSAMDQISRFDPDLARQIRGARSSGQKSD